MPVLFLTNAQGRNNQNMVPCFADALSEDSLSLDSLSHKTTLTDSQDSSSSREPLLHSLAGADGSTGSVLRAVAEQDSDEVALLVTSSMRLPHGVDFYPPSKPAANSSPGPVKPAAAPLQPHKPGGPCHHCGATDSPQWRRGPPAKPVLCNACGTRFRRTNQLGAPLPSSSSRNPMNRKRLSRETTDEKQQGNAMKQPRFISCEA